jgi:hypothetical protein
MTLWINSEDFWVNEVTLWGGDLPVPTGLKLPTRAANTAVDRTATAQVKRSDDTFKNISIKLQDIDEAILYYFKNVIKPTVIENEQLIDVPVKYGDPELWRAIQKDGYVRDKKGKMISPIIMVRRTNIARDDGMPVDKADRNLVHQFPKRWSEKNVYDRFSMLTGTYRKKEYEIFTVIVPDYINVTYESIIWTSYVTQMNAIVEQLVYSEGAYWGDPKKYKFSSKIESFDQNIDVNTEKGRIIRSNFTLMIRGHLVPETFNDLVTTEKTRTKQQLVLGVETEVSAEDLK